MQEKHDLHCPCCQGQLFTERNSIISDKIKQLGCALIFVTDANPQFAYTIGLTETFNHPELVICGDLGAECMSSVISQAVDKIRKNKDCFKIASEKDLLSREIPDIIKLKDGKGFKLAAVGCVRVCSKNKKKLMGQAENRYGKNFSALQLLVPDANGKLPWHKDYDQVWAQAANQTDLSNDNYAAPLKTD